MAELTHYRCPNCGASITNTENCEYCGSLLVRFVKRGIDLSKTSYMSNDRVYPGLIENLKKNLELQKEYPQEDVSTSIWRQKGLVVNNVLVVNVRKPETVCWKDKTLPFPEDIKNGLGILLSFEECVGSGDAVDKFNRAIAEEHARFKQLDSFSLFTPHIFLKKEKDGYNYKVFGYAIYFGHDFEGAARLISEIMEKVLQVPFNEKIVIFNDHGANIDKWIDSRYERWCNALNNKTANNDDGCYVATAVYGSYDCPEVWTLRRFRDYTLDETFVGRAFIKTYYAISPTLVKWFGKTKWFKAMWKPVLDKMVSKLQSKGVESTPYQDKY